MGLVIPFTSAATASAPAPFKHPPIRLTPNQVAESIREKLEFVAEGFAEHETRDQTVFCHCKACEGYRHVLLNPAVQRILLELFDCP